MMIEQNVIRSHFLAVFISRTIVFGFPMAHGLSRHRVLATQAVLDLGSISWIEPQIQSDKLRLFTPMMFMPLLHQCIDHTGRSMF